MTDTKSKQQDMPQVEDAKHKLPDWYDKLPDTIPLDPASRATLARLDRKLAALDEQRKQLQETIQIVVESAFTESGAPVVPKMIVAYQVADLESDFVKRPPAEVRDLIAKGLIPS